MWFLVTSRNISNKSTGRLMMWVNFQQIFICSVNFYSCHHQKDSSSIYTTMYNIHIPNAPPPLSTATHDSFSQLMKNCINAHWKHLHLWIHYFPQETCCFHTMSCKPVTSIFSCLWGGSQDSTMREPTKFHKVTIWFISIIRKLQRKHLWALCHQARPGGG